MCYSKHLQRIILEFIYELLIAFMRRNFMPTLNEILEKKSFIKDVADLFGFRNVRIYKDTNSTTLTLVVSTIENKDNYRPSFEAALSHALDCQVAILVEENLKELYASDVLNKSASIDDNEEIIKLFKQSFFDIHFLSASEDKTYQFSQERALTLANEIVFEKAHTTLTDFFKSKIEKKYVREKTLDSTENVVPDAKKKRKLSIRESGEKSFYTLLEEVNLKRVKLDESMVSEFIAGFIEKAKENGINIEPTSLYRIQKISQ